MANEPSLYTKFIAQQFRGRVAEGRLRQSELADAVGVSQSQLSKILRGDRHLDIDLFIKLCWALALDPGVVLNRAAEPAFAELCFEGWHPEVLLNDVGMPAEKNEDMYDLAANELPYDRRREIEERERSI